MLVTQRTGGTMVGEEHTERVYVEQKEIIVDLILDNISFACNKLTGIEG